MTRIVLQNADGEEVEFDGDDVQMTRREGHAQHVFVVETDLLREEYAVSYWRVLEVGEA